MAFSAPSPVQVYLGVEPKALWLWVLYFNLKTTHGRGGRPFQRKDKLIGD